MIHTTIPVFMHQRNKSRIAKNKLQETTYVMKTHHIRREYSSKARGARGDYKKLFKAYFETFIERGRELIRQK